MNKKNFIRSIAATGIAIGGASVFQDGEVVYASELDQTEQDTAGEVVIALEEEPEASEAIETEQASESAETEVTSEASESEATSETPDSEKPAEETGSDVPEVSEAPESSEAPSESAVSETESESAASVESETATSEENGGISALASEALVSELEEIEALNHADEVSEYFSA